MIALTDQVFASELDYAEISERAEALRGKASLTTEEQAVLLDYDIKLRHDRDVIIIWLQKLALEHTPVWALDKILAGLDMARRATVFDGLKAREQEETARLKALADRLNALKVISDGEAELREALGYPVPPDTIRQSSYNSSVADLQKQLEARQKRIALLDSLKGKAITWQP